MCLGLNPSHHGRKKMDEHDDTPLEKFKEFVSEILTVPKEAVQKAEDDRRAMTRPNPPQKDEDQDEA